MVGRWLGPTPIRVDRRFIAPHLKRWMLANSRVSFWDVSSGTNGKCSSSNEYETQVAVSREK